MLLCGKSNQVTFSPELIVNDRCKQMFRRCYFLFKALNVTMSLQNFCFKNHGRVLVRKGRDEACRLLIQHNTGEDFKLKKNVILVMTSSLATV